jgi:hypothetical protein
MAKWTTAASISRRFLVGSERLFDFSRRGNLPMRTDADGTVLFDEEIVQCLFRLRRATPEAPSQNLGVLGQSFLNAPERSRAAARRSEPVPRSNAQPELRLLRTGTG